MDTLTQLVSVLLTLSIASERLVEIVKGVVPWLNTPRANERDEGVRRAALHMLAVVAGVLTSFLSSPLLNDMIPSLGKDGSVPVLLVLGLGLLASGGSGMWNSVLGYLSNVKDLKKNLAKSAELRAAQDQADLRSRVTTPAEALESMLSGARQLSIGGVSRG